MLEKCPGTKTILQPTIKLKNCPKCGEEVEYLSTDMKMDCPKCGFTMYNNLASCVQYCEYAKECVGEELYNRIMKEQAAVDAEKEKAKEKV